MALKVYNSLTRRKEEFIPSTPGSVTMYVCGPTVYALSHIGHARSAVSFDVIYRYLRRSGYAVRYARNYTDVDDKIIKRAAEEGVAPDGLAERYIKAFDEDMDALGVEPPTHRPRATAAIGKIIEVTDTLIRKGYAYVVGGDVYYSVRRFAPYGRLSGKNIDDLAAGARVEVDERKSDPLDFALWKACKPGEPWWESPWGKGRPGWHIECSAMCMEWLGDTIDIHGGGKDLVFPHHENEIAQSEAATGKASYARYWLHNGFVNIEREKMSKSLGNILSIRDALAAHTGEAVRLFLLSSHYRSPIDYSADSLRDAESGVERFYKTIQRMEAEWPAALGSVVPMPGAALVLEPVTDAMDDDFNTADAVGRLFKEVTRANRLLDEARDTGLDERLRRELMEIRAAFNEAASFLGVFARTPADYFMDKRARAKAPVGEIERLVKERDEARARRDFKRADEIRAELSRIGVAIEDTPTGTLWSVKGG
jgi:cysteinyl-tRNA synthetase